MNILHWTSSLNKNIRKFIIERSFDGKIYIPVEQIEPISKQGDQQYTYRDFTAGLLNQYAYYRIKTELPNGNLLYSKVIRLNIQNNASGLEISLMPNPVQSTLHISIATPNPGPLNISITDIAGRVIFSRDYALLQKGSNKITISGLDNWHKGLYLVNIFQAGSKKIYKLIK